MYKVEGFEFATEEQAQEARREAEGIRYIRSRMNMKDAVTVLKLHNRLLQKEVFTTPVGYAFLAELHDYLSTVPYIDSGDIEQMPNAMEQVILQIHREEQESLQRAASKAERGFDYRKGFFVSTFLAAVLALALVGMFAITALSENNINIINYENALIDKYELWEQDLLEREEALQRAQTKEPSVDDEVSE